MSNIATLAENIGNDLALGLDKALVIRYWEARQSANSNNTAPTAPVKKASRPRAVESNQAENATIRNADKNGVISLLGQAIRRHSCTSIARAMYGEDASPSRGDTIKKWGLGLQNPMRRSVENIRVFLIGEANGDYADILKAPGGNRKGY